MAGCFYYITTLIVLVGALSGRDLLRPVHRLDAYQDWTTPFVNGDGKKAYCRIAVYGYSYEGPDRRSFIAFWPAYPLVSRWVAWATGIPVEWAVLIVAQLCLVGGFAAMGAYAARRFPNESSDLADYVLLALGLLPTTFFFRMAYSESMLVCLVAVVLYGIVRQWPLWALAALVGLATAARPVGIALVPVFMLYAWRVLAEQPAVSRFVRLGPLVVFACWGLIAFVVFQWIEFGEPLACVHAQVQPLLRHDRTSVPLAHQAWGLLVAEPIWSVYVPSRPEYWANYEPHGNPLFSLQFANPIYFVGTVVLVIIGWRKKWLNEYEVLVSAGLLLIPYVTKSYDNAMASFGRFSAVVLPAYIVMGHILARLGPAIAAALLAISAFFLGVYSALFAAGYRLI